VGTPHFIAGIGDAEGFQTFISSDAIHNDIHVTLKKVSLADLQSVLPPIPYPWTQGFNTVVIFIIFQLFPHLMDIR